VEGIPAKWYQNDAHAFVLECQDESLNERNTAVLANGAKAGCDPMAITPILEYATPELLALQGKGVTSRSLPPRRTVRESFPSHRSSLSRVSCLARARPIIATDVPGCREIVQHESNGLLVPVKDHSALARAIERLISDQDLRRTMGRKGRGLVKREFPESIVVQKTLDVYRSMLGQRWPESI
jgi:glycosyltransferase involved in cell wall biosynthesis